MTSTVESYSRGKGNEFGMDNYKIVITKESPMKNVKNIEMKRKVMYQESKTRWKVL